MKSFLLTLFLGLLSLHAAANALAPGGQSVSLDRWRERVIVIPAAATAAEQAAARLLADTLGAVFQRPFPILTDAETSTAPLISVGATTAATAAGIGADPREQGYRIAVDGEDLFLLGGTRGPNYAVLALLEEDFGCRWYHLSDAMQIPTVEADQFAVVPRSYAPPFEVREVLYRDAWANPRKMAHDPAGEGWAAFNRQQPISYYVKVNPENGGGLGNADYFVHTYASLVPSDRYFATHPEYFPMRNGQRFPSQPSDGQLCYTSDGVVDVIVAELETVIAQRPGTRIYSVSSNDNVFDQCECPTCTPLIAAEGVSGAQLQLANRVAERLAVRFPTIKITTLAYVGSQTPPPQIEPSANTVILYAPIRERGGSLMLLPLREVPKIVDELRVWNRKAENIYLWDYIDNGICNALPTPFPNFDLLDSNWPFLVQNGVNGVFLEAAEFSLASLGELKTWYCAKKLWNPDWQLDALLDDFIAGYYGVAAPEMREYVALQRNAWHRFHNAYQPGLALKFSAAEIAQMRALLNRAIDKAGDDAALRFKLNRELFTVLTLIVNSYPDRQQPDAYAAALDEARAALNDAQITHLGLNQTPVTEYLQQWQGRLDAVLNGSSLPLYCTEAVALTEPQVWYGEKRADEKAISGQAYRQPGGVRHDWGLQWNFSGLTAQLPNQQICVARIRYRPELTGTHEPGSPLFQVGLWKSGVDRVQVGTVKVPENLTTDDYQWGYLFRVYLFSPAAEGYFYTAPGIGTTEEEAIWSDYLEFIPIEQFEDRELAEALPLITL